MKTNQNEPAHPCKIVVTDEEYPQYESLCSYKGLTKREKFAAMAMQGVLSNPAMVDTVNVEWVAEYSVKQADALITALNEEK